MRPPEAWTGLRPLLFVLFVVSGFSALIYQSIWSQYLGLILGHAAYAQTLVLMMFMGGMALGSWWVSRGTQRWQRLIGLYALAELVIGLLGFAFHPLFVALTGVSQTQVLPALEGQAMASVWQWGTAALLIAPQSVLLGTTFPLIAGGVLRLDPERGGNTLGGLYFTNGIGAAVGVLVATFVLLPKVGLPGALQVAASMNILLAVATAWMSWRLAEHIRAAPAAMQGAEPAPKLKLTRVVLLATFLSSAASFGYEIGWVRMLNQALGTTLHGFELMLAAFIAGMALGGLWVRKRGDGITDVLRYVGFVQVAMGVCALVSVPILARSFEWVGWVVQALSPTPQGYALYSVATAALAVLVMVPAAFFAGMTLPLFTNTLLRQGAGESAIGRVYAANTLGAILGVLVVVHVLIPALGISLSIVLAAATDVLVGVWLLRAHSPGRWTRSVAGASLASLVIALAVVHWGLPKQLDQASGVFRTGRLLQEGGVHYFRDGSTATVSVHSVGVTHIISTNGKPDAGLTASEHPPTSDEITMVMLGVAPLAWHPRPERVALIGWGSGLSTHTVLGSKLPLQVDTIEIEPAMWEGAKTLGPRNSRAYDDPRSHLQLDDARKFFAGQGQRYDVIVSEPSNPWVSGVASLFTKEFYGLANRHLADDGLLVQWIHIYEMTDALLAEMVAALVEVFPNSEVYLTNANDLVVLARKGPVTNASGEPWAQPALTEELRRVGLHSPADLQVRRLGGAAMLRTFVRQFDAAPHSDFKPTVALAAPEARFRRQNATLLTRLLLSGLPILNVLECRRPVSASESVVRSSLSSLATTHSDALAAAKVLKGGEATDLFNSDQTLASDVRSLMAQRDGDIALHAPSFQASLAHLANSTVAHLDDATAREVWVTTPWLAKLPDAPAVLRDQLALYAAMVNRDWPLVETLAGRLLSAHKAALPIQIRHQAYVYGVLAAMARGEVGATARWEREYGAAVGPEASSEIRNFLKAWDGHEPVCMAASVTKP
jgi:spermidine synthase